MQTRRQVATRLIIASICLLGMFIALAAVAYWQGRTVERDSRLISLDAVPGSIDAHAVRGTISRSIGYAMLAGMTERETPVHERALEVSREADESFSRLVQSYRGTMQINPERDRQLMEGLTHDWQEYRQRHDRYLALVQTGDRSASNAYLAQDVLPAYEKVIAAAEELLSYNHNNIRTIAVGIEGSIATLRWTVIVVLALAVLCGAILVANIITRRRQQKAIEESEHRLRLVLDNLFAHVAVLELNGRVIEVNRASLDAAGLLREDVVGTLLPAAHWWSYSPEAQARLQRALHQAAAGENVRFDIEARITEGRMITVDFGCGPLRDANGRVILLVATAVDITARKELEQQFLRAQRMDAIGMLAGGLAHDLNNILAPMLMAAGLLKMRLTEPSDQRMVELIEGGAQRGAGIIRQLLTFSRGTEGARGLVQLRHLVKDMVHIVSETFPRNIELTSKAPPELWALTADATQLHQVLLNLCVNARDAMPRGGKLTLTAENLVVDEQNSHRHPQANAGRYVLLSVADTGDGIPAAIINRIFDPFFTTKPVGKGTGLGLSTVLGIVKSHGGLLTVESEPGRGTTFRIYLPAAEGAATAAPEAVASVRGGGETILLVDDEPAMRDTSRHVLEQHNYRVLCASQGEEALQLYVDHRDAIRLLVTDVDMPVMSGYELIRTLRVLDPELRFLILSGSTSEGERPAGIQVVDADFLRKPCDPATLLAAIAGKLNPAAPG